MKRVVPGVALAALIAVTGCAGGGPPSARARAGDLLIDQAFAFEPITTASGAAYFRIHNGGTVADTVLEATSPAAKSASFHGSNMAHLDVLEIPAGGEVELKPGATHLMFSDFGAVPRAGDSLTVTLRFARAGSVTLRLPVRRYGQ
jgi:periplasmic copper chaperone A